MKYLILLFAVAIISCNKPKEELTAEELKTKYGIVIPDLEYEGEEIPTSQRGGKKKANSVVVVVWFNDLTLTESGGIFTTTISPNAQWAGVQKYIDPTTSDGAVSVCNWNYSVPTGGTKTCQSTGPGHYRSWTSD